MKKYWFVIVLFLCFPLVLRAQDCKELLTQYVEQMGEIGRPDPGKVYFMEVTVQNTFQDERKNKQPGVDMQITMAHSQMIMQTAQFSLYQDSTDAFLVFPKQQKIVWSGNKLNPQAAANQLQIMQFQKELVAQAKVTSCTDLKQGGETLKLISLALEAKTAEELKVKQLKYSLDTENNRIKKLEIFYTQGHALVSQTYQFKSVDFNYKGWKAQAVKNYFLSKGDKLKAPYQQYSLINNKSN